MSDTARKVLGVALAVAFIVAAAGVSAQVAKARTASAEQRTHAQAQEQLVRAEAALRNEAKALAQRTQSAAALLNHLMPTLNLDDSATRQEFSKTVVDYVETEERWSAYHEMGAIFVFAKGQPITVMTAEQAAALDAVRADAETSGSAFGITLTPAGGVALVGAAKVPQPGPRNEVGVVVISSLVDSKVLEAIAKDVGGPVLLATASTTLDSGGPAAAALQAFHRATPSGAEPCCDERMIAPGVQFATWVDPAPALAAASAETARTRALAFGVALLFAVGALVFGFRKNREAEQAQLLRETAAQLQAQREELKRLSLQISNPAIPLNPNAVNTGMMHPDDGLGATSASVVASRYEELAPLGQGGMAKVSVAVTRGAEGFRRLFVVKRLRPELAGNTELVNQFIDEARLGASLVHSNVVPVFDFGRDADGYYMAQEYILGRDVDAVVQASMKKRGRPLEAPLVLAIAAEALKALSYAHAKTDDSGKPLGLVHRDVSPNNLMLTARGEVKLLDFGIVKGEHRLTKTQTGVVKGNLFFMSPEQAKGVPLDARSDLFSLGLVLFYAATGDTLYQGGTSYELLTRAALGVLEADLARVTALAPALSGLLLKALQFDPAARFTDADDFARAVAATGQVASAADLKALMESLLKDELAEEQARFAPREGA
jgi:hypothetical protein